MPYATGRTYYDADSHIMELPDFLTRFADPGVRDASPKLAFGGGGKSLKGLDAAAEKGGHPDEKVREMVALGADLIAGPKGYQALGAFNREERTQALDPLSDYPHFEGGRNPLGRFSGSLEGHCPDSLDRFYSENFSRVFSV